MKDYKNSIEKENIIMLLMAAAIVLFNIIGFIIAYFVWQEYRNKSDFIDINGARLLNFHISFVIYEIVAFISCIVLVGFILVPLVSITYFILTLIGMIKYGSHKYYKYPITFNII